MLSTADWWCTLATESGTAWVLIKVVEEDGWNDFGEMIASFLQQSAW